MRAILVLAGYSFKMFLRDRGALFWGVVFPIMLMGLIGLVFGKADTVAFTVSVVDESAGGHPAAAGIRQGLEKVAAFKLKVEPRQAALEALRAGDRSLVVVLPAPSGAPGGAYQVQAYHDESRAQVSQAALAIVYRVVDQGNLAAAGVRPLVTVAAQGVSTRRLSTFDFLLPGIMAMTLMQSGLMGITWVVSTYREKLVLKRVLTTPVRPLVFYAGLVTRFTVVNLLQVAIIFLVATFVFGAKTVGSLAALAFLALVGSFAFLGIGFAISAVSRSPEAAGNLGSVANFPMMFLSGTFWPREMIPERLQPVIGALPLTPLVEAMRGVGAQGEPLTDFLPGIAYLLAWGVAGFMVAARYFRYE